jgi:hypothetical protein
MSVDKLHHIERAFIDRLIDAEPECAWHRDALRKQSGDDSVLSNHVVSGGQDVTDGRTTQGELRSGCVDHSVREI